MGRPPSKIHDPIGYDQYYAGQQAIGLAIVGGLALLFWPVALVGGAVYLGLVVVNSVFDN
jgi:hypothetical protein